jgi:hypothetical protein
VATSIKLDPTQVHTGTRPLSERNSPALLNEVRLFSNLNETAARGTVIEPYITLNGT